jgi:hypothetical protein
MVVSHALLRFVMPLAWTTCPAHRSVSRSHAWQRLKRR